MHLQEMSSIALHFRCLPPTLDLSSPNFSQTSLAKNKAPKAKVLALRLAVVSPTPPATQPAAAPPPELMMMPKKIAAAALLSALAAPVEAGYEGAMTCGSAYSGTTTGGSSFHNEDGFSGFDAVWTLTLTEETTVTVAACQTDHSPNAPADANQADWVMRMYNLNLADGCVAADTCHIYTELGNDDDDSCSDVQETRTFTAPAGEYIYVLDGLSPSDTGPFYVEVTCTTPDNPPVVPIAFVAANNCFGVELDATLARGDCPALGNLDDGASW
jgi:hypothetical protein